MTNGFSKNFTQGYQPSSQFPADALKESKEFCKNAFDYYANSIKRGEFVQQGKNFPPSVIRDKLVYAKNQAKAGVNAQRNEWLELSLRLADVLYIASDFELRNCKEKDVKMIEACKEYAIKNKKERKP